MGIDQGGGPRFEARIYSVREITTAIKQLLDATFTSVWVEGEISNFTHHGSGHMYFTLKDRDAQIRCVMFKGFNRSLTFRPRDGELMQILGDISMYPQAGSIQVYVREMKQAGLGDLFKEFERLKAKLQAEGLFDANRRKPLPFLPARIGIVTSPTGAAVRDMIHVIRRRFPNVLLSLMPVRVQGDGAAAEIATAIRAFHEVTPRPDVLIVGRGGGSIEDLWAFNEEVTARAIADSDIPVISAVGHEIDFTIADFVADLRAATPSAAAELVVPNAAELTSLLDGLKERAVSGVRAGLREYRLRLDRCRASTLFKPERFFDHYRQALDMYIEKLGREQRAAVDQLRRRWREYETALGDGLRRIAQKSRTDLAMLDYRLRRFDLEPHRHRLALLAARLEAADPDKLLARGYSICEDATGGLITSYKQVNKGQLVAIRLHEGRLTCQVRERTFL
ncbi:exodeoxyribonuclease VII large subunit [bacterium]|nr:exodeoxyribonuclease VII large subunit [candidate division CSSED10-310 bacterium]